jgi:ATP/maltotriose-dependent transcriptional regulator MalT
MDSLLALEISEKYAPHSTALEVSVSLSARERTIVLLMGHGLSNKRIARQLSIAPETVKSHAKRIFWKLTVQTRAQAVYRASALGLISPSIFDAFDD